MKKMQRKENLIDIQKMFQFKIHEYLCADWSGIGDNGVSFLFIFLLASVSSLCVCLKQRRKLLLMMKTKGCGDLRNHYAKILLNERPGIWNSLLESNRRRKRHEKKHEMLERFEQSIFYYFPSMKNVSFIQIPPIFFVFFSPPLLKNGGRLFKMKKEIGLEEI